MKEIKVDATLENLSKVFGFLQEAFDSLSVKPQIKRQIKLCVEEIYMNITNYAYNPETGPAKISLDVNDGIEPTKIIISFSDHGKPYDPLKHEDPDMELDLEDAPIGGLGIYLVKTTMDKVQYESKNGHNVLTIEKDIV